MFEPNLISFLQNAFFLSFFLVWTFLLNHFRSRGLLWHLLSLCDTHTHTPHTHIRFWLLWARVRTHRRDLYMSAMIPTGFEPIIPASERQQTCDLEGTDTGIGSTLRLEIFTPYLHCAMYINEIFPGKGVIIYSNTQYIYSKYIWSKIWTLYSSQYARMGTVSDKVWEHITRRFGYNIFSLLSYSLFIFL